MTQSTPQWLASYAAEVGTIAPTQEEMDLLLELASTAAHASERPAAPLTCWLAARAALAPAEALAVARRLAGAIADEGR